LIVNRRIKARYFCSRKVKRCLGGGASFTEEVEVGGVEVIVFFATACGGCDCDEDEWEDEWENERKNVGLGGVGRKEGSM
jgi:hypothetical protein